MPAEAEAALYMLAMAGMMLVPGAIFRVYLFVHRRKEV
jgi:hypothetical protein